MEEKRIDFGSAITQPILKKIYRALETPLEHALALKAFNGYYAKFKAGDPSLNFFKRSLEALSLKYILSEEEYARIPQEGPVITVSNHPFGGIDGVILGAILTSVRPDVKLITNYMLSLIEEIQPWVFSVDPFDSKQSRKDNLTSVRESLKFLKKGGMLGLFPAGIVSHLSLKRLEVTDPPWKTGLSTLIRRSRATVVPIYFEGSNSFLFQSIGLVHPRLRTLLLLREICNKANSMVSVRIGQPVSPEKIEQFSSGQSLMDYLRLKTYILKSAFENERPTKHRFKHYFPLKGKLIKKAPIAPIIAPIDSEILAAEIAQLPQETLLVEHKDFSVYLAHAEQIPLLLKEIGRLREVTFREVGEGTGKEYDLDNFDNYYQHLFMWNNKQQEIVGGYRIGPVDQIIERFGYKGLYVSTLFKFKKGSLDKFKNSIELGRSFIVSHYQRKHTSLLVLWQGIGAFIRKNPHYNILFGPVSISHDYQSLSQDLIVSFLKKNRFDPEIASLVKAKNPPKKRRRNHFDRRGTELPFDEVDELSALVSEIETDQKGIPVLLRHYLKLDAVLLSFNVDNRFSHCIDGLILVDLTKTDPKLVKRILGEDGAIDFFNYHNKY